MRRVFSISLASLAAIIAFGISVFVLNNNLGKGALQVTSQPESKVYLDGKLVGKTPLCLCQLKDMVNVGNYNIRLVPTEGNFIPFEQRIPISQKVLTVVDRSFAEGGQSSGSVISLDKLDNINDISLSAVSLPPGARVFLDSGDSGQTPVKISDVTQSDHEIKLTKDGYQDKIIRIKTVKGYQLNALVFLGSVPQISSPSAVSTPAPLSITKVLILDTPTGFLRVRDQPSLSGNQVGQVLPGEKYDLLGEQDGWYKIKLNNGITGWISSQYSQKQS